MKLEFKDSRKEIPNHGDCIIFMEVKPYGFGSEGIHLAFGVVEYYWSEVDGNGYPTGLSTCYAGEESVDGFELRWQIGSTDYTDNAIFWQNEDEFWKQIDTTLDGEPK